MLGEFYGSHANDKVKVYAVAKRLIRQSFVFSLLKDVIEFSHWMMMYPKLSNPNVTVGCF